MRAQKNAVKANEAAAKASEAKKDEKKEIKLYTDFSIEQQRAIKYYAKDLCAQCAAIKHNISLAEAKKLKKADKVSSRWAATFSKNDNSSIWKCTSCGREAARKERIASAK